MGSTGLVTRKHYLRRIPLSAISESRQKHNLIPPAPQSSEVDDSEARKSPSHATKTFASFPPELHHMIASHLTYPDLLALKLTNKYFTSFISPKLTVLMRIQWVQSRHAHHLPVPKSTKLSFKSDTLFVANVEVNRILRRRRSHLECLDYAFDRKEVFGRSIVALEFDSDRRFISVRGKIQLEGSKACLVTGDSICPRIRETEAARQRYGSSLVGRLGLAITRTEAWAQDSWRELLPWPMAGRRRNASLHPRQLIVLSKIILLGVTVWFIWNWGIIWVSLSSFIGSYWNDLMADLGVRDTIDSIRSSHPI